jgi:hypothetical protein
MHKRFPLFHTSQIGFRAHKTCYPRLTGELSLGSKRSGFESDHSFPASVKVEKTWSYTLTPPIYVHGVMVN